MNETCLIPSDNKSVGIQLKMNESTFNFFISITFESIKLKNITYNHIH